jgi:Cu(I)/Ag(I) efflux system membrane fusion protein/cobalt-zinc-cadmium efflux system membrane fusion protein
MSRQETSKRQHRSTPPGGRLQRLLARFRRARQLSVAEREALTLPAMTRGMQAFSGLIFFLFGVLLTWLVVGNPLDLDSLSGRAARTPEPVQRAHEDSGALYRCPMHPEVIEPKPGECPICGMDLVELREPATGSEPAASPGSPGESQVLYWYAPMDPAYIRDEPGVSPMGMRLVPKYAEESDVVGEGVIRIDPVQVQNIGVVSHRAEIDDLARYSRTVGILDFNADHITWVNTKFEGWIEAVHVNYVGQEVREGQPLFEIYSPELVTTQEEHLRALEYRASLADSGRPETLLQAENLVRSSRDRLAYWDITDEQIRDLEDGRRVQRRLTVAAPTDGVVAEVMSEALEGMYVRPGMNLYKIAELSVVWVHAEIYELDIPWIREGLPAVVTFRNDPEKESRGRVLFLYPEVNRETRTLRICVAVPNPDRRLRPGMYADVVVQGPPVKNAVVVPRSAVIRSGERNIVFVDLGNGRFEPRDVAIGIQAEGHRLQILAGIAPGERVVTQAQFLLDSESRIQEAISKFRERGEKDAPPPGAPSSPGRAN